MSRHGGHGGGYGYPGGGGNERENIMISFGPQPQEFGGAQNEIYGMGYAQSARYHHQHMANVNQSIYGLNNMEIVQPGPQPYPQYASNDSNYYQPGRPQYGSNESSYYQQGFQPQQSYQPQNGYIPQHNPNYRHHHHPRHHYGRAMSGHPQSTGSNEYSDTHETYDGARPGTTAEASCNAKIVANVAREMGVDPCVAVATMLAESNGNHHAVGDHGNSFGLFQLNRHGELADSHLSPEQAFDPVTNARVALSHFHKGQNADPGAMAAAAQRPHDRAAYARKVNYYMARAQELIDQNA